MHIKVRKLDSEARIPCFAKPGDAGADLRSIEDLTIGPGSRALVRCGLAIELPEGFCGLVIPRSGLAAKHGITVVNAPGLIDSGYRGEICVVLLNTDASSSFQISKGDRIAQLTVVGIPDVEFDEADDLSETSRGESGFGSSGVS